MSSTRAAIQATVVRLVLLALVVAFEKRHSCDGTSILLCTSCLVGPIIRRKSTLDPSRPSFRFFYRSVGQNASWLPLHDSMILAAMFAFDDLEPSHIFGFVMVDNHCPHQHHRHFHKKIAILVYIQFCTYSTRVHCSGQEAKSYEDTAKTWPVVGSRPGPPAISCPVA